MREYLFYLPLLLLLSLTLQVENGIDVNAQEEQEEELEVGTEQEEGLGAEEAELVQTEVEYEPYKPIEQMIKIGITAFSILLLVLSISAYRKTRLKAIVYAAIAFGLFAVQIFFDYLEDSVEGFETPYNDVIMLGITLAILVLFFMAIVRKR
jgi:hypothetical protein